MTFRKSHIVFGIVCVVTTLFLLIPTYDEEYLMEVTGGYGLAVLVYIILFWLGIFGVCYIAYLIIDKIRSNRKVAK